MYLFMFKEMEENKRINSVVGSDPLDFMKIFKDLLKHKRLYFIVLPVAFVLAVFYALSLPNYYSCTVTLAPEMGGAAKTGGSLAGIASSFGINLGSAQAGDDAINPTLYPDLMNSVDFKTSLFSVPVTIEGDKDKGEKDRTFSYYDYLMNEQTIPWWSSAIKSLSSIFNDQLPMVNDTKVDPFRLTKEQTAIIETINKNVVCDVDKKTGVITINVTDQNPVIAAKMADTVKTRLQNFITEYRTSKARVDLDYNKKIAAETKARYEKARRLYAEFSDANQDVILETVRQRQTELENEMQLQYNAYQQVAAQLLAAEAKVQEETPAFTTLQSATVPVFKAGPKRPQLCLIFILIAFFGTTVWILYKEDDIKPLLGLS